MKYLWILLLAVVIGGGLVLAVSLKPVPSTPSQGNTNDGNDQPDEIVDTLLPGRYQPYQEQAIAAKGYDKTILFFHAAWCPECRAFEMAINESVVPDGTQILKINYDDSDELKAKYGVTLQSTFVKVDDEGNLVSKWVGYGEDKSVEAILENT